MDDAKVNALKSVAEREPANAKPRVDLGNLYFDAERYDDAIAWYEQAVKLQPNDENLSTDLGVCYYYTNQPDKALARFDASLEAQSEAREDAAQPRHRPRVRQAGSRGRDESLGAGHRDRSERRGRAGREARARHAEVGARRDRWTETRSLSMLGYVLDVIFTLVAIRAIWKMLQGVLQGMAGPSRQSHQEGRRDSGGVPAQGVQMARDPVCGTYVVPDRAVSISVGRQTMYFCSDACRDKYRAKTA